MGNQANPLFSATLNGADAVFNTCVAMKAGEVLDFVANTTGTTANVIPLTTTIRLGAWDVTGDYNATANGTDAWSYGELFTPGDDRPSRT